VTIIIIIISLFTADKQAANDCEEMLWRAAPISHSISLIHGVQDNKPSCKPYLKRNRGKHLDINIVV
jgi:hypothetical protein